MCSQQQAWSQIFRKWLRYTTGPHRQMSVTFGPQLQCHPAGMPSSCLWAQTVMGISPFELMFGLLPQKSVLHPNTVHDPNTITHHMFYYIPSTQQDTSVSTRPSYTDSMYTDDQNNTSNNKSQIQSLMLCKFSKEQHMIHWWPNQWRLEIGDDILIPLQMERGSRQFTLTTYNSASKRM